MWLKWKVNHKYTVFLSGGINMKKSLNEAILAEIDGTMNDVYTNVSDNLPNVGDVLNMVVDMGENMVTLKVVSVDGREMALKPCDISSEQFFYEVGELNKDGTVTMMTYDLFYNPYYNNTTGKVALGDAAYLDEEELEDELGEWLFKKLKKRDAGQYNLSEDFMNLPDADVLVEDEPDSVWEFAYDCLFDGNKNFRPSLPGTVMTPYNYLDFYEEELKDVTRLGIKVDDNTNTSLIRDVANYLKFPFGETGVNDNRKVFIEVPNSLLDKDIFMYLRSIGKDITETRDKHSDVKKMKKLNK